MLKIKRSLRRCPVCAANVAAVRTFTTSRPTRKPSPARATTLPPPIPDLALVLSHPEQVQNNIRDRKFPLDPSLVDDLRRMELEAVGLRREIQSARERRNAAASSPAGDSSKEEGSRIKARLKELEPRLAALSKSLHDLALQLPNSSHPSSPVGAESAANVVKTLGPRIPTPPPPADPTRDHLVLSSPSSLAWTDFPSASLISGPSWPLLMNEGAVLELALTNYAMSAAIKRGFAPVLTPDVVRSDVAERCGFRPRDGEAQQTYFLGDGREAQDALCLVGTAEVPLVGMAAATTFNAAELPLRRVALGRAFRAEAGARGADSRGLYRVHQFSKVEMVVVCTAEDSEAMLEELRSVQEEILGSLGLSLRVLEMPTEELGASAHRKYDIEGWMPGRGKWGELSSASNCTDYQARRLGIKYRPSLLSYSPPLSPLDGLRTPLRSSSPLKATYAHTLNATAAAIPRLIVALLENGAVLSNGGSGRATSVRLPDVLKRFWIGTEERVEWVKEGELLRP